MEGEEEKDDGDGWSCMSLCECQGITVAAESPLRLADAESATTPRKESTLLTGNKLATALRAFFTPAA